MSLWYRPPTDEEIDEYRRAHPAINELAKKLAADASKKVAQVAPPTVGNF
jgi:hypothetical protein